MARKRIVMNENLDRGPLRVTKSPRSDQLKLDDFFEFYKKFLEVKKLEGISDRTLEDYEKHYKPATINLRLRTLKAYFHWLYNEGYIDEKLYKGIKLMKIPVDLVQPLPKENIRKMLRVPNKSLYNGYRDYLLMLLMLDTGIRVKEAVNLEIDDVDIKRVVIVIRGEISKTRSFRELPISLDTCKKFREIIKMSKEYKSNYVFLNELGGKLSYATVSWCFRNYGKKAGIN